MTSTRGLVALVGLAFVLGGIVTRVASSHRPPAALALNVQAPSVDPYVERSRKAIEDRQYPLAVDIAQQGLVLQRGNVELRINLAVGRLLLGQIVQGRATLQALARDVPTNELVQGNLAWADSLALERGKILWEQQERQRNFNEHEKSAMTLEELRLLQPTNTAVLNNLGVERMALHEYAVAKQWFAAASKLAPDEPLYRNNAAWADAELAKLAPRP